MFANLTLVFAILFGDFEVSGVSYHTPICIIPARLAISNQSIRNALDSMSKMTAIIIDV
jgi:hypothetical protein